LRPPGPASQGWSPIQLASGRSRRVPLRILHIDHATILGGAERSVLELANAQLARGHTVTVAAGGEGPFLRSAAERGIDVMSLALPPDYLAAPARPGVRVAIRAGVSLVASSRRISDAIDAVQPDLVHVHTRKAQLATVAMLRHSRPVLFHLRDALPRGRVLRTPMVLAVRRSAHAVALTPWMTTDYVRARAMPRSGTIRVVPSGVDQRRLAQLATPWLDGTAPPRIGFVGQIASWKGPHLIVELAELIGARHDVSFHLIGDVLFPEAERRYGEWLKKRIASSPARDSITWHAATASPEDAMKQIDILVHTSLAPEPFGRVLVEAMASHRPIVAFRRGSTTDVLGNRTALFAEGDRVEDVAVSLEKLLTDRPAANAMAVDAAEAARTYEPSRVADLMDAEYATVIT
jgi:glycosyltransferase involved in cell wall biosynthesis